MRAGSTFMTGRLIGASVRDAEGRRLGTVVDLAITGLPDPEVKQLILGARALAGRLQVDVPVPRNAERRGTVRIIPWSDVEEVRGRVLRLRAQRDPAAGAAANRGSTSSR